MAPIFEAADQASKGPVGLGRWYRSSSMVLGRHCFVRRSWAPPVLEQCSMTRNYLFLAAVYRPSEEGPSGAS